MTPTQFRTAIARLGLSQLGAGRLLGYDGRTVRRWCAGEVDVPAAVSIALRLMVEHEVDPETVRA